jgi:hypothetical protein
MTTLSNHLLQDTAQLSQDRFGLRVAARLSFGNTELSHDISERLRVARQQAVTKRKHTQTAVGSNRQLLSMAQAALPL